MEKYRKDFINCFFLVSTINLYSKYILEKYIIYYVSPYTNTLITSNFLNNNF